MADQVQLDRFQVLQARPRFELTALIDVLFILVLFFIVTHTMSPVSQGIDLTLPSAVSVKAPEVGVTISINARQRVFWNGVAIAESQIAQKVAQEVKKKPNVSVLLQADKATPYVRVVSVLDKVRQAGVDQVMLEAEAL